MIIIVMREIYAIIYRLLVQFPLVRGYQGILTPVSIRCTIVNFLDITKEYAAIFMKKGKATIAF